MAGTVTSRVRSWVLLGYLWDAQVRAALPREMRQGGRMGWIRRKDKRR